MWLKWPQYILTKLGSSNRSIRLKISIFKKKRIAPFHSAPPKTPISEVWSRIDKDSKSRPKSIKKSINRWIAIAKVRISKKEDCALSTVYKLSYESKIIKFGSGVGELWLAEKSVTYGRAGGRTGLQRTFLPLFVKTNSLRSLRSLRE